MKWTREPPSEPGWYRRKRNAYPHDVVDRVRLDRLEDGRLYVAYKAHGHHHEMPDIGEYEWLGPIPEPEGDA